MLPATPPDSVGKINGKINGENGKINGKNGKINGETNNEKPQVAGGITNDDFVYQIIVNNPGIKREKILKETDISLRTIDRILQRMKVSGRIEYRGSRKTGGWLIKT